MKLLSAAETSRGSKFTRSHQHPSPQSGLCGFKELQILPTAKDYTSCFLFYYSLLVYPQLQYLSMPYSSDHWRWESHFLCFTFRYMDSCQSHTLDALQLGCPFTLIFSPWPYEFIFLYHQSLFHCYACIGIWLYVYFIVFFMNFCKEQLIGKPVHAFSLIGNSVLLLQIISKNLLHLPLTLRFHLSPYTPKTPEPVMCNAMNNLPDSHRYLKIYLF